MSSQRLALVMLVLGLVAGAVAGSLVDPLISTPASERSLAAGAPLNLSPGDDGGARALGTGVELAPVAARSNEAHTSAGGDVDESLTIAAPNALRVTDVVPGRLAARAGLLDGDPVLSVSGRAVDAPMSEQRIYMDVQGGTSLLRVLRGGTELELSHGHATTEQPRSEMGARFSPTTR